MTPIRILIVEDDLIIAAHLSKVIENAGYHVAEVFTKGESVHSFLDNENVDVILMDIQLAGNQNGIETSKLINQKHNIPIVFLTANVDKATFEKSKEAYPYAFLAKPFNNDDLLRTLELVFNAKDFGINVHVENDIEIRPLNDRVFVRDKNKLIKLKFEDILYVEADRNYCTISTNDRKFTLSAPLKKFETRVDNDIFIRIHRSFLVNIKAIDQIDDHYVFINGKSFPVSKSYKQDLNRRLTLI